MSGTSRGAVLLVLLGAACAPRGLEHGPSAGPQPRYVQPPPTLPAPALSTTAESLELRLPDQPPEVWFTELPALRFRTGPPLRLRPLAKGAEPIGLSPDGQSWVLEENNASRLVTPSRPEGVVLDVWNSSASFSADGKYVAIWAYHGPFGVIEVASGRLLMKQDVFTCAVAFSAAREIVFQTASNEGDAQMYRISLDAGAPVPIGGAPNAEHCHVSIDGSRWLIESYAQRWFVDGTSGRRLALAYDPRTELGGKLSTAGDRVCSGSESGLTCVRYPDGTIERIWSRPTSDVYPVFDPSGKRALFHYVDDPDGVYDAPALVDFEARTVRPLKNFKLYSGSMPAFTHGGVLLTTGSGHGLHVYDIERGQKRLASHRPLYGNFSFPHQPRVLIAGTDEPMDLFMVSVQ